MKICQVTSAHNRYDGRIFLKQCTSLAKKYDVVLLCYDDLPNEKKNNVKIISVQRKIKNRYERFFKSSRNLKNKCLEIDADIYEFHDPDLLKLALFMKKQGKIVIFDLHEDYAALFLEREWVPSALRKVLSKIYQKFENKVIKKIDYVFAVSDSIFNRVKKINSNVILLPNYPILVSPIKRNSKNNKEIKLCFAGGITSLWNHENIVQAIQKMDNVKYKLAGSYSKDYYNKLKEMDKKSKLNFLGRLSFNEIQEFYKDSDIGMALCEYRPNVGYHEGSLGNTKIFEYMMYELPIIFTDFKIFISINEKLQFGLPVNPNNIEEIEKALNYLIANPKERIRLAKNGRKLVETKYNWSISEKDLFKVYKNLEKKVK